MKLTAETVAALKLASEDTAKHLSLAEIKHTANLEPRHNMNITQTFAVNIIRILSKHPKSRRPPTNVELPKILPRFHLNFKLILFHFYRSNDIRFPAEEGLMERLLKKDRIPGGVKRKQDKTGVSS